jgi:hypothetical protein
MGTALAFMMSRVELSLSEATFMTVKLIGIYSGMVAVTSVCNGFILDCYTLIEEFHKPGSFTDKEGLKGQIVMQWRIY